MKRLKVLFCILIFWFSVSILHSVPVDAELGVPSSGNWETVFEQAFSLNSFDQWQNFISENYVQMRTLWEEKMDAEISTIVSSVTESDVVHSTDVYKDYILKYLQAQKDSILRDWETNSEQQISEERNTFLGKLSGIYVSRSDASIPGTGQDYFSQMQIWSTNFQDTLNLGLSEFQTALSQIEQSYSELLEKLQKTDEEIAQNEYRIRAYEGMVWDNVKGLVGNMAAQLISNTLLHEKNTQGNSLVTLRNSLSTADENISELLSMDRITIQNNYSQKFICTDMNSLDSCTTTMIVQGGMCQGPTSRTVKITEIESIVRPDYDDGFSKFFQSSEITAPAVTSWSGGTDIFGNGIGTPVQSERNYILHYNTYQTYRDRLNRPGELMYEFISKMYSELQKPPEERSLTAAAEAVSRYLTEQKIETDKMAAFWQSKVYTDINLANDSTYRFVYNTGKEKDYFRQSFVKDIELLYRLQENQKKLETFVSGNVTLAYGFSEQNIDTVRGKMPDIYDSSVQPLYGDSIRMPYLRADFQKTYSIAERNTALLENSAAIQSVMDRIKSSLKTLHPTDNIEIDYVNQTMNLHSSSVNLFSDWYVTGHDKVGGNLRTDGLNYRRYRTNFLIDALAETGGLDYRQDSEENIWVEILYRIKDKNAEANYNQWKNFQTDVNSQTVVWGSQLNSLQNWTVQSANFRNRAALWNQEKLNLQNEIQDNYNKSMEELMNEKSSWLSDMDSVRSKAVSGKFNTEIPAIPLLSYEKNISELQEKAENFQNMPPPDYSSFERFASVLDDTMNGFLNLLTANSITDAAVSTSSSALNSMASMLSSQKTMADAYEIIPEKRKEYYEAVKKFSEGGMCAGEGFEKNRQICEGIYNGPFFKRQYAGVEVKNGQIEVSVMEKTGKVYLKDGGDAKDQDDYIHETVKKTYYINTPGEAKIADMSSLGGFFQGNWSSKTAGWQNSEKKEFGSDLANYWQYWTDSPQKNTEETADSAPVQEERETLLSSVYREVSKNSGAYLGHFYTNSGTAQNPSYTYNKDSIFSKLMNSMTSRELENSLHFSNLARDNAKNEASKAETLESLSMAVVTGGLSRNNLSSWLKDRMTQAVKSKWAQTAADAMCPGNSTKAKEPCQASEIAILMLQARSDKQERKNAEYKQMRRDFPMPGTADLMHGMSKVPILKEIVKPIAVLNRNMNVEVARGLNKISSQIVTKEGINYMKGKDLRASLNAGKSDPKGQAKQFIQEQLYDYVVNLMDPNASPAKRNGLKNLLKYRDNRIQAKENDRKGARQREELVAQVAVTVVLSLIPGGQAGAASMINGMVSSLSQVPVIGQVIKAVQTAAQAISWIGDKLASVGSYLSEGLVNLLKPLMLFPQVSANTTQFAAVMKNYAIASNMTSTAFAAADGNSEGVLAGLMNGALMSFTGPMGLGGSVSYTPPEKKPNFLTDSLSGTLDRALSGSGSAPSGWGGNIHAGNSIFNAGITFAPGSGTSIDLGFSNGEQWKGQTWFGNLSYNVDSGHTSVSVGAGQEYGTNLSVSASTDKDEKPSMTLNFGCDMKGDKGTGTNCGGGDANRLGLGGSLTFREGGGMDIGFDVLGNQFGNASFDPASGEWGNPQFNNNWGNEVMIMNHQDTADEQYSIMKKLADIEKINPSMADEIRKKLEAGSDSSGYDPLKMIPELILQYPQPDRIDFFVKQMKSEDGQNAEKAARETVEKIRAAGDPERADAVAAQLDAARKRTETEGVPYEPNTVISNALNPEGKSPEEAAKLAKLDKKMNSEEGILDRFSAGIATLLGALGISAVGLGLLNRTGAGSGSSAGVPGSESGVQGSETAVRPNRREEGEGGEAGGEGANEGNAEKPEGGGYDDGNPNKQHYDALQSLGVLLGNSASPENGHNHSLENAEKQIADLIKKDKAGITVALKKALDSISSNIPDAEEKKKILKEAATKMQIENMGGSTKTFQDFLNAAVKNPETYSNENIMKVAESVLSKQKTLNELTNSASQIEKILKQKGIDTSEFWKAAAATALKKIESGSPIPKDFMKSPVWNSMPKDAKTAMQEIVANTVLKQNFTKQINDLKKLDLNKFLAGYDKLKNTAENWQGRVPTGMEDLNKALADKAGADFRNKMDKTNGLQDAYNAKQALLEKLKGNEAARTAVESKYKEVEQNVLKERLIQGLEKLKTAEDLEKNYLEILQMKPVGDYGNLTNETKKKIADTFSDVSATVLSNAFKESGTAGALNFIREIQRNHPDLVTKLQEHLGKLQIEDGIKKAKDVKQLAAAILNYGSLSESNKKDIEFSINSKLNKLISENFKSDIYSKSLEKREISEGLQTQISSAEKALNDFKELSKDSNYRLSAEKKSELESILKEKRLQKDAVDEAFHLINNNSFPNDQKTFIDKLTYVLNNPDKMLGLNLSENQRQLLGSLKKSEEKFASQTDPKAAAVERESSLLEIGAKLKLEKLMTDLDSERKIYLGGKDKTNFETALANLKKDPNNPEFVKEVDKYRSLADTEIITRGSADVKTRLETVNMYQQMASPGMGRYVDISTPEYKAQMKKDIEDIIKSLEKKLTFPGLTEAQKKNISAYIKDLQREPLLGTNAGVSYQFDISRWNGKVVNYSDRPDMKKYHMFGMADSNKVYSAAFDSVFKKYPSAEIHIGDLSMPGGGASFHHAYNAGRVMDICLFDKDMKPNWHMNSKDYSKEATKNFIRELVAAGQAQGKPVTVWFNDETLKEAINKEFGYEVVKYWPDHDNHLHVIIGE